MDKEPNFFSYEAKLAPPCAPVELRQDIFKPQNKKMTSHKVGRLENKEDFEIFFAQEIPSK